MSEIADLRQKADTCLRLAEAASSARANELFKRLAAEYRAQADALETPMASPPLSPPADEERVEAPVAAMPDAEIVDEVVAPPVVAEIVAGPAAERCDEAELAPVLAPLPSAFPQGSSAQWLAELQALRNRL